MSAPAESKRFRRGGQSYNGNTISTYVGGNYGGGYTYDLFNRQKTYTPDGTVFTTTTYRPDGLRHSIGTTKHIWDNGNIVGDITGSSYKQYFRALNLIYSLIGTTKQYYYKTKEATLC